MAGARPPIALAEIASALGLRVQGDGDFRVEGVASLEDAGPGQLSFVRSAGHAESARRSSAGALLLPAGIDAGPRPTLISANPALDFARLVERFFSRPRPPAGLRDAARLAEDAEIAASASLSTGVVVGHRVRIGERSFVHPGVVLYDDVVIGDDCEIHAGCVLREGSVLGDRVTLQPGVIIGGDGFGYLAGEDGMPRRVPHVGNVEIGDAVEVGAATTIDRGTLGPTRIGRGSKIDNLVQIAHNCEIGESVIIVAQSGLAGSTIVERGAVLMARSGSTGHLRIGAGAFVGALSAVTNDVDPGARVFGMPAVEGRGWHRSVAALARLPDALRRLRALERKLGLGRDPSQGDGD